MRSSDGEPDLLTWAAWFETADRTVGYDLVVPYRLSTVFLGLDHDLAGVLAAEVARFGLPPLIFETMVFDDSREETSPFFFRTFHPSFNFQRRYRSWDEATSGHRYAVKIAERMLRWMEFRSARQTREVNELEPMLEKNGGDVLP
jgi:hypothetical protein